MYSWTSITCRLLKIFGWFDFSLCGWVRLFAVWSWSFFFRKQLFCLLAFRSMSQIESRDLQLEVLNFNYKGRVMQKEKCQSRSSSFLKQESLEPLLAQKWEWRTLKIFRHRNTHAFLVQWKVWNWLKSPFCWSGLTIGFLGNILRNGHFIEVLSEPR